MAKVGRLSKLICSMSAGTTSLSQCWGTTWTWWRWTSSTCSTGTWLTTTPFPTSQSDFLISGEKLPGMLLSPWKDSLSQKRQRPETNEHRMTQNISPCKWPKFSAVKLWPNICQPKELPSFENICRPLGINHFWKTWDWCRPKHLHDRKVEIFAWMNGWMNESINFDPRVKIRASRPKL